MSKKESDKRTAIKLGLFMAGSVFGAILYIFLHFQHLDCSGY
ncbi:hypothetical protein [Vibrio diabolicus]|nr:hypothetical protein [Vibrio diabolicus]